MAHFATENIRTVALVGDGASGKTTLAEALLAKAGAIAAPGSVERGTTVSDFDPLEKAYQHSLRASVLHLQTGDTHVHLIDTPGFPDFIGQAIGAAMRGLRPIAEIQYLDYLLFGLEPMSDDLATVQWRTKGGQKAPVIVRTRGHRLEGVWHS